MINNYDILQYGSYGYSYVNVVTNYEKITASNINKRIHTILIFCFYYFFHSEIIHKYTDVKKELIFVHYKKIFEKLFYF